MSATLIMVASTAFFSLTSCLTVLIGGVKLIVMTAVGAQVGLALLLAWYGTRPGAQRIAQAIVGASTRFAADLRDTGRWWCEQIRLAREKRRQSALAEQRRRELATQRRREALERARRPVRIAWPSKRSVDASRAVTYGIGAEHVYFYTFPTWIENARLKQENQFRIKVGMASGHPIDRIRDQITASKTAIAEHALVLLVFRTHNCRHLESWLHARLEKANRAIGSEWFTTHPNELISLFQTYLDGNFVPSSETIGIDDVEWI